MEHIADIVLKHDGYIYGEYVWSQMLNEEPTSISCRFVSKNIFEPQTSPQHFLTDLNQYSKIQSIKTNKVHLENGLCVNFLCHGVLDEVEFIKRCDFTCNLLDIRRDGVLLRYIPPCIAYELSPYNTVRSHIMNKQLVPVSLLHSLDSAEKMLNRGWTSGYATCPSRSLVFVGECSICQEPVNAGDVFLQTCCHHPHHSSCISRWFENHTTCPMCREELF